MTENKTKKYLYALFLAIAVAAVGLVLFKFDFQILFFIRDHVRNPFLNVVVPFYTGLGDDGVIWIVVGIVMLIPKKTRKCGIMMLTALTIGFLTGECLTKNLVCRERPFIYFGWDTADLLIKAPSGYSFPSGHTCSSFAASTSIFMNNKKWGTAARVLAACIAFSRVFLFVHFPSDIIVGILWGLTAAFISKLIIDRIYRSRLEKTA